MKQGATEVRFEFGENWSDYSKSVDDQRIKVAMASIEKLLGDIRGKTFLDIGCGSGLFSLAAIKLGASRVVSIDIDPNCVKTTQKLLEQYAPNSNVSVAQVSVFDLNQYLKKHPELDATYDIVYSWGVLHHTGDMYRALDEAAQQVKPGGTFCVALYRKTRYCEFWKKEKKFFVQSPQFLKKILIGLYMTAFTLQLLRWRQSIFKYAREYKKNRGMSMYYDIKDWMGGYPYESISSKEFHAWADTKHLETIREFTHTQYLGKFFLECLLKVFRWTPWRP